MNRFSMMPLRAFFVRFPFVVLSILFTTGGIVWPRAVRAQSFQAPEKTTPSLPSSSSNSGRSYPADPNNSGWRSGAEDGPYSATVSVENLKALTQIPETVVVNPAGASSPDGVIIGSTTRSLSRGGSAWTPVMGEFHYSRYPAAEWRDELLKMKSGGIDIVATYVFWIHHEESEGRFDWSGDRDLRHFVEICGEVGMQVIVRLGPWCHGEVRNGGLPDWIVSSGCRLRSDDPRYLDKVRILYTQIGAQLKGLLWKDGGPVVGAQLENEYRGPAEHLLTLKKMAIEAGIIVPLYTRTGWPALTTPMPAGEIVPLYGVYAEGFWDREITPMPGNYWTGFRFSTLRVDANIANEMLGRTDVVDDPDVVSYPYLTCEIGGGMMSSYHRRILVDPRDIESTTLVKIGSGSVLPGYYMYQGGTNPDSATGITLQENQSTAFTNWNDMPVKNYDFQAPLGAAGQVRPQFHLLRRQHLFMHDFGYMLPGMLTVLPKNRPDGKNDNTTLRWAMRSNGRAGFIFVNNYQRHQPMPTIRGVQFALNLPPLESVSPLPSSADATRAEGLKGAAPDAERRAALAQAASKRLVPATPIDVPANTSFILPFNFDLGNGAILAYVTAQLLCYVETSDEKTRTYFFSEIPGIPPELAFSDLTVRGVTNASGRQRKGDGLVRITNLKTGHTPAISLRSFDDKAIHVMILSYADSLDLYKLPWGEDERIFISKYPITIDTDETLRVLAPTPEPVDIWVYPKPDGKGKESKKLAAFARGVLAFTTGIRTGESLFTKLTVPGEPKSSAAKLPAPLAEKTREAAPQREIPLGKAPKPVPAAPTDADFAAGSATWKIFLPATTFVHADTATNPILRIHYTGDVARVLLGGKVIVDDFYNGLPLDVPLARYEQKLSEGAQLTLEILPLRKDAPIMLADSARPNFGGRNATVELRKLEIVSTYTHTLTPIASDGTNQGDDDHEDEEDAGNAPASKKQAK